MITILNERLDTNIAADSLIIGDDRRTLGELIKKLRRHVTLNEDAADMLAAAIEARNHVSHQFFIRSLDAFSDDEACQTAMRVLDKKTKQILIAAGITGELVKGFCETFKINRASFLVRQDI